jgi:hypothetical protein
VEDDEEELREIASNNDASNHPDGNPEAPMLLAYSVVECQTGQTA